MVNSRLQVIHALGYPDGGTKAPQTYHFSGTYCSPDQKTVLTSRVDTDGFLLGRFIHNFGNVTLRSSAQTGPDPERQPSNFSTDVEWRGSDFTYEFGYNTNMHMFSMSYLQNLSRKWMAGVLGLYFHKPCASWLNAAVRYEDKSFVATAMLEGLSGFVGTYTQKISDNVNVTSELRLQLSNQQHVIDSQALLGWEYKLRANSVSTSIDTSGTLKTVFEERTPMGIGFTMCSEINFPQRLYRFGFRMSLGI